MNSERLCAPGFPGIAVTDAHHPIENWVSLAKYQQSKGFTLSREMNADYRRQLKILLINHGREPFAIRRGERIAQLVPAAVTPAAFDEVDKLCDTARGAGGFGSTGVK